MHAHGKEDGTYVCMIIHSKYRLESDVGFTSSISCSVRCSYAGMPSKFKPLLVFRAAPLEPRVARQRPCSYESSKRIPNACQSSFPFLRTSSVRQVIPHAHASSSHQPSSSQPSKPPYHHATHSPAYLSQPSSSSAMPTNPNISSTTR